MILLNNIVAMQAARLTVTKQHQPYITSKRFMLIKTAVFDPLLSITILFGQPVLPMDFVKNAVAAAS
ncbi:MAG: hypothetical protein ABJE99_12770, partial [Roseobacter sp.]